MISGPGGVGKGTVVAALAERRPDLVVSVSATTRPRRPHEVDGRHYHFLSDDEFDALIANDGFLEWAEFAGARYGTPWSSVHDALATGATVVLEIDVQGARQVRERFPDALLVFLKPPDLEALARRLVGRGTDDRERIAERLAIARQEMAAADAFDHVLVNDRVDEAVAQIVRILDQTPA